MYGWLEHMVYHTLSKAEAKGVSVFFHPCWSILGVLCGQYGCDSLALLLVQWCIKVINTPTDGLRGMSKSTWMVGVHGASYTNQGNIKKCASFYPFTHGTSLECCMTSINEIPLLGCMYNCASTSYIHPRMNRVGCQCLH